jgi:very-short-patch-repair endonuclease
MRLYQDRPSGTVPRARQLRRDAPTPERRLLRALREAFPAHKWRHQAPVGPFFADILCFAERVLIEVDGDTHAEARVRDAARTKVIESEGYRVIRFTNDDVMRNIDGVVAEVANSLSRREREGARSAQPSGKGEGDQPPSASLSPSPRAAARLAPLPAGEGE